MYILFTGAPGSKWSSVVKNIYWSDDVDHTDYSEARTYRHDADTPGRSHLMHIGAYWDPGMEFGVDEWDKPFSGTGKRIVKAHTFAHQLDKLKAKGHPIVMVYRNDYECLEWWKLCGEFRITYPNYQHFREPRQDVGSHTSREPGHDAVHQRQQGQNHTAKGQRGPLQATRNKFPQQRTTT